MDTDAELSDSWWKRVKYYAQLPAFLTSLKCRGAREQGSRGAGGKEEILGIRTDI
ncbi:MAG: hypothetical protein ACYTXI_38750 [Nostoc sp.]